jgi:RNA polymerase sigma factor (TIGR02999 family)
MAAPGDKSVTQMLQAASQGDQRASAELLPLVYAELRELADSWMGKLPPGQTLQPTALVHEAYVRLVGSEKPAWESRRHFFFAAARAMRDILLENARRKARRRKGEVRRGISADSLAIATEVPAEDMLALNEALERLERRDPRKHEIVLLRFFAGLTAEETAELLGTSLRTVQREWRYIRARLYTELAGSNGS